MPVTTSSPVEEKVLSPLINDLNKIFTDPKVTIVNTMVVIADEDTNEYNVSGKNVAHDTNANNERFFGLCEIYEKLLNSKIDKPSTEFLNFLVANRFINVRANFEGEWLEGTFNGDETGWYINVPSENGEFVSYYIDDENLKDMEIVLTPMIEEILHFLINTRK